MFEARQTRLSLKREVYDETRRVFAITKEGIVQKADSSKSYLFMKMLLPKPSPSESKDGPSSRLFMIPLTTHITAQATLSLQSTVTLFSLP